MRTMKNLPSQPKAARITTHHLESSKHLVALTGRHIDRAVPMSLDQRNFIAQARPGMVGPPPQRIRWRHPGQPSAPAAHKPKRSMRNPKQVYHYSSCCHTTQISLHYILK